MDFPPIGSGSSPHPPASGTANPSDATTIGAAPHGSDDPLTLTAAEPRSWEVLSPPTLDPPELDADQALALLQALSAKLRGENLESATEAIQANREKQQGLQAERLAKAMVAAQAAADAQTAGTISEVFSWAGVGVAVIAAAATVVAGIATVASLGTSAPVTALIIVGCVAAMSGAVLATGSHVVSRIPGLMESMGPQGQQAFIYTMMALQIATALVSLVAGVGSAVGAAKAAADAATLATKVATVASFVGNAAQIAGGVTEVSGGATNIAAAKRQHEADLVQADIQEIAKFLKLLQQGSEKEIESIRTMQEMNDEAWKIVAQVAQDQAAARQAVWDNSHA